MLIGITLFLIDCVATNKTIVIYKKFKVYRIYDNRYRKTHRSYNAYIDTALQDIVGECCVVLSVSNPDLPRMDQIDKKEHNTLTVIATPYRVGTHIMTMPTAFLPIIDQLVALHRCNYIHGDIRAFNMVFGGNHKDGWLIDFDFAGVYGIARYPPNYRGNLDDGSRLGEPEDIITKYDDWYALFNVIFDVYVLYYYKDLSVDLKIRLFEMKNSLKTKKTSDDIPLNVINELEKLLKDYENAGGRFEPGERFSTSLKKM